MKEEEKKKRLLFYRQESGKYTELIHRKGGVIQDYTEFMRSRVSL